MTEVDIDNARRVILDKLKVADGLPFHELLCRIPCPSGVPVGTPPEMVEEAVMVTYVAVRSLVDEKKVKMYPFLKQDGKYIRPGNAKGFNIGVDEWVLCLTLDEQPTGRLNYPNN